MPLISQRPKYNNCMHSGLFISCLETLTRNKLLARGENIHASMFFNIQIHILETFQFSLNWHFLPLPNLAKRKRKKKKTCLIISQNEEEIWLAGEKVWELSQLDWLAEGYYTDGMCTDSQLTHQGLENHLFWLDCLSSLDTVIWFCLMGKGATLVWL